MRRNSVDPSSVGIWHFLVPLGGISNGLHSTLIIRAPFSLILAGVGLIESLMTMTLIDELTNTRGSGNRECVGQGVANITCGLLGGCAMIGQSLINIKSGGRGRVWHNCGGGCSS